MGAVVWLTLWLAGLVTCGRSSDGPFRVALEGGGKEKGKRFPGTTAGAGGTEEKRGVTEAVLKTLKGIFISYLTARVKGGGERGKKREIGETLSPHTR